ncbi:MAG: type II toxin-antitoxin system Phd/YefM family antitoxin [Planctomycetales bacterium]|nr:type II toxin-antitoxin system Phd/YefM family antitoxin [Planctomycetales bacterium]MCA9227226.1 type II toxin-antitoxin system Phd/YefM family antitoxin [Planctomycetales bacterium]
MLNLENGIDSLTNFKRQTSEYVRQLRETGSPVVLTVNGKAEVVVQNAAAYQRLVELAARADREETIAAIREGLADSQAGRMKPARKALRTLGHKYGLSDSEP